jgi:hypothetical protein
MENKTKTEATFELVEALEIKKHWLKMAIIVCLILAPVGLVLMCIHF